jgi:S1-C subfamily serine protease
VATILVSQTTTPPSVARAYDEEERRIGIFEKTSRSVVFIDTFVERRDSLTTNIMEVPLGSGSGFVWDKQGHIVTNYHVVRNARSAQIAILLSGSDAKLAAAKSNSLSTTTAAANFLAVSTNAENSADVSLRQTFTATIVGVDPGKDIAVLKIEADPVFLFPIAVGSSANIKVGQQAMAIGNPFGTYL